MNERPHVEQVGTETSELAASLFPEVTTIPGESAPTTPARPRARRAVPAGPPSAFGAVPVGATVWSMQRMGITGVWEPVSGHPDASGVRRHEFPISELSPATVRERWGAGTFRVGWFKPHGSGGRKFMLYSAPVTLDAEATPAPAPVASAPAASPIGQMVEFMDLVENKAKSQIQGMAELARVIAGNGQQGLTGRDLLDALRDERAAAAKTTEAAIAAAVAPLQAKLDALASASPAGGGIVEAGTKAAASLFGDGAVGQILAFASAQPELAQSVVENGAPIVKSAISGVLALFAQAKASAPVPAPAAPRAAPRTMPAASPAPAGPAAVDVSLGGWSSAPPSPGPQPSNGASGAPGPVQRTIVVEAESAPGS